MWAGVQGLSLRCVHVVRKKARDAEQRTHSLNIEEYRLYDGEELKVKQSGLDCWGNDQASPLGVRGQRYAVGFGKITDPLSWVKRTGCILAE